VDASAARLAKENEELKSRLERQETLLREIRSEVSCRCDEGFTSRGRHEPNSLCHLADEIDEALKG
jgi:hypothetical protein